MYLRLASNVLHKGHDLDPDLEYGDLLSAGLSSAPLTLVFSQGEKGHVPVFVLGFRAEF